VTGAAMQLLNWWTLNIVVTTLLVTCVISILSMLAGWGRPTSIKRFFVLLLPLFAFAMLGFVTGLIMGDSRESAVGSVVPAVLTLFGALAAYIVGSKGIRERIGVSTIVLCFAFSLLVGTIFGNQVRSQYEVLHEHPDYLRSRDIALEQNKLAVEVQRLEDYIEFLRLKNQYSEEKKLDLSRFDSTFEKHETEAKGANAVKSEPPVAQSSTAQKK
jgi:hypothetical protein